NATVLPRNIASSSYSGFRFLGGAIFPLLSAPLIALGRTRPILGQRYRTLRGCCAVNLWLSGPASDPTSARQNLFAYCHQRTSSHALNETGSLVVVSDSTAAELAGVLTPEGFELLNRLWREGTYASADTLKLA